MKKSFLSVLLWVIVGVGLGIGGVFGYMKFIKKGDVLTPTEQNRVAELTAAAGKLILLPENEEPAVATITDASVLINEQPFYAGAQNGDVILFYKEAAKAIIYSPERNIIVNVGPVVPEQTPAQ